MNSKYHQRNGFIMVEVVLALAMVAMVLTSLMMVEGKVFNHVISSTFKIERFYAIRNSFLLMRIKPLEKEETVRERVLEEPPTKIMYERIPVNPSSSLARFAGMFREVATGTWHEWGKQRAYDIINYQFDPDALEEKKDGAA